MHRDVERRRREQMANLYGTLRSSIPCEHNKGKGSVCDDIQEAVDYIKQMQENIQELSIRKDKLKRKAESCGCSYSLPDRVMVNQVMDGLEILISQSIKTSEFGASKILAELQESELNVVSCVSTRTQEGFLYKIHIEARDMTGLDVSALQERLSNAIK